VFLLLLCNDPEVLGPWVNPRWLNLLATVIVGILLMLSGTLMATTVFPHIDVKLVVLWLFVALAVGVAGIGLALRIVRIRSGQPRPAPVRAAQADRKHWRMPPLALLKPVTWSPGTRLGMMCLRGYLVISVVLLAIKAAQIGH
ncbi:MAG TPA: hypothetical protein VGI31_02250, partial [Streptosporangiaceae bacterium]